MAMRGGQRKPSSSLSSELSPVMVAIIIAVVVVVIGGAGWFLMNRNSGTTATPAGQQAPPVPVGQGGIVPTNVPKGEAASNAPVQANY